MEGSIRTVKVPAVDSAKAQDCKSFDSLVLVSEENMSNCRLIFVWQWLPHIR